MKQRKKEKEKLNAPIQINLTKATRDALIEKSKALHYSGYSHLARRYIERGLEGDRGEL